MTVGKTSDGSTERAQDKRTRRICRLQPAARPGVVRSGSEARRAAAVILEVLAGVRTPASAAAALSIRLPRYYLLEQRAIGGLIAACEPRPVGRLVSSDRRLARLERELAVSRRELARHQALARSTQRALGLAPPAAGAPAAVAAVSNAQGASSGTKRRRKPAVRALRAARMLRAADSPGPENSCAVQGSVASPAVPQPACAGAPVTTEAMRREAQSGHGGSNHAGRPEGAQHR